MKQKKILLLGGALAQVPSILKAKEMGLYVITCDYLPDNPGHKYADEYYNISTTDKEAVLELAKSLNIDAVVCYASDPAATTAAYVSEKLKLPTSPYESVKILTNKDSFRDFLYKNGFNSPKYIYASDIYELKKSINRLQLPVIIKPVDSSGSKGISILYNLDEIDNKFISAINFSRAKKVIVEEFVETVGPPLAGDAFSVNGKLVFWAFADDYFDLKSKNPLAPVAEAYPYTQSEKIQNDIINEIQRLLDLLKMGSSAYNLEVRVDSKGRIFLMEVAPRNGGNGIPVVTKYSTGVDMIEYTIKAALGEDCSDLKKSPVKGFWSTYMVHSKEDGVLDEIWIDEDYRLNNLVDFETLYREGDTISSFTGSNGAIGTMISKYESYEEMIEKIENFDKYVKVLLKKK